TGNTPYPMATFRLAHCWSEASRFRQAGDWRKEPPVSEGTSAACLLQLGLLRNPTDINGRQRGDKARAWDMRLSGRYQEGRATRCRYSVVEDVREPRRHCW